MNLQKTGDGDLVDFLKAGKRPAFEEIYRRYWYKLFAIAYHHTGIREEAEEIIQEIFLDLWRRRADANIRNLDLYLTIAVKNQIYDFFKSQLSYRRYREYLIFNEISKHYDTENIVGFSELSAAVEHVLNLLPEKSAEVFKRSRFENQSVKEIAQGLNLSEKAVEYHITKSLRFLRENLRNYYSEN